MRRIPSRRNLDVVSFLDQGRTLHETAAHFFLEMAEVRRIERLTRDYQDAVKALERDPADLMLLARVGRLMFPAARALAERGIHHVGQLEGVTSRELLAMRKIGRSAAEQIVRLAAERGIEIQGSPPPSPPAVLPPRRVHLREPQRPSLGVQRPVRPHEMRRKG
jgi:hypothetical protein